MGLTPGEGGLGDSERVRREPAPTAEAEGALLRAAFEHAPIAVGVTDAEGRYVRVNQAMAELVGEPAEELVGQPFHTRIHPDDLAGEVASMQRLAHLELSSYENEYRRIHPRGEIVWVRGTVSLALAPDGRPIVSDEHGLPRYIIRQVIDITAEREAAQALAEVHEEAVRANQAKNDFLSRMSHELRTPLNAVLGFAQLLELEQLSETQREAVDHILKGGRHLLNLINEVLDIARIESGTLALSPEAVEMTQAATEALDLIRPVAAAAGIALPERILPCPAFVVADLSRLKQVLINLLANAVKYNRPNGSVGVHCQVSRKGWGRISVTDTGAGITTDKLPRLFTAFERLGAEHSDVEGTGVGLALSRRLVEAMGGVLSVDTVPGEGSTFWVDLPLAPPSMSEQPVVTVEHAPRHQDRDVKQPRLLYVEDNVSNLRLLERLFSDAELLPAMQGEIGLVLARQHRPDVILLDLHLPDISGEEVLRRLRSDPQTAEVPVIVLSADATAGQIQRLLRLGAMRYLTKPFNVPELLAAVAEALGASDRNSDPL